jgi:tRNA1(Val) A37 N6-methylase TrmN6
MLGVHSTDSLNTVASEIAKYNINLVAVHEVTPDNGSSEQAGDYTFVYGNENANLHVDDRLFIYEEESKSNLNIF